MVRTGAFCVRGWPWGEVGGAGVLDGSQDGGGALAYGCAVDGDGSAAGQSLSFAFRNVQAAARIGELVVQSCRQIGRAHV